MFLYDKIFYPDTYVFLFKTNQLDHQYVISLLIYMNWFNLFVFLNTL